jgi:hypothetical protein
VKRLSHSALALLATLLFAVPTESQAFFGFFGFSFGFGGGWGGNWWGPGYWGSPYYYGYRPYWGYPYWHRGYGHYPYYSPYSFYQYPYTVTVPTLTAPETSTSK